MADSESFKNAFQKFFAEHWLSFLIYFVTILIFIFGLGYKTGYMFSKIDNPKSRQVPSYNKDSLENIFLRKEVERLTREKDESDNRKKEIENIVIYSMEAVRNEK